MTVQQAAFYLASLILATSNLIHPHADATQPRVQPPMVSHLFQSKCEPVVRRVTIYDGPFRHGSPMLTHEEDSAAISDCYASFHLPSHTARYSDAI